MRVLVLCDDFWHPAQVPQEGLKALAGKDFTFDWITDASEWSQVRMSEYAVVVLTKSNNVSATNRDPWMTAEVEQAFVDYVRSGNGLIVIHSGTAGYQQTPVLRALMGGVFLQHPPQCAVTITPREGHPITVGVQAFTVFDEHYQMALDESGADVFLIGASQHGTQPAGWFRQEGRGKVCILTPGHNLDVWLNPDYQQLIVNALQHCSSPNP